MVYYKRTNHSIPNLAGESELKDLLSFRTGASIIPPMGFASPSLITATSTDSSLPNANTSPCFIFFFSLPYNVVS